MPIFEYKCAGCGEAFEVLVTRADAAAPDCPRCGATDVEKQFSAFAVAKARPAPPGPCGSSGCACRNP